MKFDHGYQGYLLEVLSLGAENMKVIAARSVTSPDTKDIY